MYETISVNRSPNLFYCCAYAHWILYDGFNKMQMQMQMQQIPKCDASVRLLSLSDPHRITFDVWFSNCRNMDPVCHCIGIAFLPSIAILQAEAKHIFRNSLAMQASNDGWSELIRIVNTRNFIAIWILTEQEDNQRTNDTSIDEIASLLLEKSRQSQTQRNKYVLKNFTKVFIQVSVYPV